MSKRYLVWVTVEELDEDTGDGHDIDLGFASTRSFDDAEEAEAFALVLHAMGGGS